MDSEALKNQDTLQRAQTSRVELRLIGYTTHLTDALESPKSVNKSNVERGRLKIHNKDIIFAIIGES